MPRSRGRASCGALCMTRLRPIDPEPAGSAAPVPARCGAGSPGLVSVSFSVGRGAGAARILVSAARADDAARREPAHPRSDHKSNRVARASPPVAPVAGRTLILLGQLSS